jgi:pyridoxal phosphate enzyme (YggS family)
LNVAWDDAGSAEAQRLTLRTRVEEIKKNLEKSARDPSHPPALLAVTKTVPKARIDCLPLDLLAGAGENRVQEICGKFSGGSQNLPIHMIGRLQTNKVKYIIDSVRMIQSVDSMHLAQEIDRQAQKRNIHMPVLVQVNIGGELQKGGLPPGDTIENVRAFARLPGLAVKGLMAVFPIAVDVETLRPLFVQMRALFEALQAEAIEGVEAEQLSMGMSADAYLAAQEGATMVRMGSAIFGPRAG